MAMTYRVGLPGISSFAFAITANARVSPFGGVSTSTMVLHRDGEAVMRAASQKEYAIRDLLRLDDRQRSSGSRRVRRRRDVGIHVHVYPFTVRSSDGSHLLLHDARGELDATEVPVGAVLRFDRHVADD
jgi:hypothetical protein